ncbi:YIP1 family protein [bacterium]|nr:YIP1 family protein [bacterium]
MVGNMLGLIFRPRKQWESVASRDKFSLFSAVLYTAIMACIPAAAWYYGTTQVGWVIGSAQNVRLTEASALPIIALFYLTMIGSVCVIGYMIHWMSETYGANTCLGKGVLVAALSSTPLFLAGALGLYPQFWVDISVTIVAVCYAVYLYYLGIPIVMKIPEERGFLYASAVIAFCLVIVVVILCGSVIAWDMGFAPEFTD